MTLREKYQHSKACLQNGVTEKYSPKEWGGTTQFIKVKTCVEKSYILLHP